MDRKQFVETELVRLHGAEDISVTPIVDRNVWRWSYTADGSPHLLDLEGWLFAGTTADHEFQEALAQQLAAEQ